MKLLAPNAIKVARNKTITVKMDGDYGQTYKILDTKIAKVDPKTGVVTGLKVGNTVLIVYVDGKMVDSCIVQVL